MTHDMEFPPGDPRKGLYDYDEASAVVGLAASTIKAYVVRRTYGMQRGRDYVTLRYRHGRYPRNVVKLTVMGLTRLLLRGRPLTRRGDRD